METLLTNHRQNNRKKQALFVLFLIRMLSAAAVAVPFSSLALFITGDFHLSVTPELVGIFFAFHYIAPILGGYLGDKFINFKLLFITGNLARAFGCLLLSFLNIKAMYLGLAFFLIGSMTNSVSINTLITLWFPPEEKTERKVAFLWNYIGMNLGFLLGFGLAGYLGLRNDYSPLFLIVTGASVALVLFALIFIKTPAREFSHRNPTSKNLFIVLCIYILAITAFYFTFQSVSFIEPILSIVACTLLLVVLGLSLRNKSNDEKKKLLRFFGFLSLSIFFWSIYLLSPTALVSFINEDVNRKVHGFLIAPQWLDLIDSIVAIFGGALIAFAIKSLDRNINRPISTRFYFGVSLLFLGLGAVSLIITLLTNSPGHAVPLIGIIFYIIALSLAEIFIAPIGYATVGELVPKPLYGVFTGLWTMSLGIGSIFASYVASIFLFPSIGLHNNAKEKFHFLFVFNSIAAAAFILAIVLLIIIPLINKASQK